MKITITVFGDFHSLHVEWALYCLVKAGPSLTGDQI